MQTSPGNSQKALTSTSTTELSLVLKRACIAPPDRSAMDSISAGADAA